MRTTGAVGPYVRDEASQLRAVIGNDYGKKLKFTADDAELLKGSRFFQRPVTTRGQCDAHDMDKIAKLMDVRKSY
jgi:hypothetical protein